jgi:hypothetical protein
MKLPLHCQFFHENHKFFLVLEITATEDSLVLIFFFQRTKTSDSLNLKTSKNLGTGGSLKIQIPAQHWFNPITKTQ